MLLRRTVWRLLPNSKVKSAFLRLLRHKQPSRRAFLSNGVLELRHDAGFFSNCSVALLEIARSQTVIEKIDATKSFKFYKTEPEENSWSAYFCQPMPHIPQASRSEFSGFLLNHSRYKNLDFKQSSSLVSRYFQPSPQVTEIIWQMVRRYEINFEKVLAVHYRGTDKQIEIQPEPVSTWLSEIRKIAKVLPDDHRILVQTDQQQFLDAVVEEFGSRVFYLRELPLTKNSEANHHSLPDSERTGFALNLLAATIILSRCEWVLTHTGNGGYWAALFRGTAKRLVQL